jgi:hypothetical protein
MDGDRIRMSQRERQRLELDEVFDANRNAVLGQHVPALFTGLEDITDETTASHRFWEDPRVPTLRDTFPGLLENVRQMSVTLASEQGWERINAGLMGVTFTPNSPDCATGPSVTLYEMRW